MPATAPDQTSLCPRCESTFECGVLSGGCWCAEVKLDAAVREDLVKFYEGCLCPDCLQLIADGKPKRPSVRAFLAGQLRRRYGPATAAAPEASAEVEPAAERIPEAAPAAAVDDQRQGAGEDERPA